MSRQYRCGHWSQQYFGRRSPQHLRFHRVIINMVSNPQRCNNQVSCSDCMTLSRCLRHYWWCYYQTRRILGSWWKRSLTWPSRSPPTEKSGHLGTRSQHPIPSGRIVFWLLWEATAKDQQGIPWQRMLVRRGKLALPRCCIQYLLQCRPKQAFFSSTHPSHLYVLVVQRPAPAYLLDLGEVSFVLHRRHQPVTYHFSLLHWTQLFEWWQMKQDVMIHMSPKIWLPDYIDRNSKPREGTLPELCRSFLKLPAGLWLRRLHCAVWGS